MRNLYLVRHGKPQYPDEHSYCVGQTDFSHFSELPVCYFFCHFLFLSENLLFFVSCYLDFLFFVFPVLILP